MSENKTIGSMTERQRIALAHQLRSARADEVPALRADVGTPILAGVAG
jgi:hypothetical protein